MTVPATPLEQLVRDGELEAYCALVTRVMTESTRDKQRRKLANKGPDHARAVVSAMFANAEEEATVYANRMSAEIYSAEVIRAFLARNPKARITVYVAQPDAQTSRDSVLLSLHPEIKAGRIIVRHVAPGRYHQHVLSVDHKFIRVENDQEAKLADVFVNDAALDAAATAYFTRISSDSTPIPIPL